MQLQKTPCLCSSDGHQRAAHVDVQMIVLRVCYLIMTVFRILNELEAKDGGGAAGADEGAGAGFFGSLYAGLPQAFSTRMSRLLRSPTEADLHYCMDSGNWILPSTAEWAQNMRLFSQTKQQHHSFQQILKSDIRSHSTPSSLLIILSVGSTRRSQGIIL